MNGGGRPGATVPGTAVSDRRGGRIRSIGCGALLAYLLAVVAAAMVLSGCTSTRYVPVESVRTEYVGKDNAELLRLVRSLTEQVTQKDRQIDSLMHSRNERLVLNDRGDTLRHDLETIVYRSSHREKELERLVESQSDSIRELRRQLESVKADTIPVPYPVEKRLTRWERVKVDYGGAAIVAVVAVACAAVWWLARRRR